MNIRAILLPLILFLSAASAIQAMDRQLTDTNPSKSKLARFLEKIKEPGMRTLIASAIGLPIMLSNYHIIEPMCSISPRSLDYPIHATAPIFATTTALGTGAFFALHEYGPAFFRTFSQPLVNHVDSLRNGDTKRIVVTVLSALGYLGFNCAFGDAGKDSMLIVALLVLSLSNLFSNQSPETQQNPMETQGTEELPTSANLE